MIIPVSRLVRDYHYYSKLLVDARSCLEMERRQEISTKRLRELTETVAITADKANKLTFDIDEAYDKEFTDWSPEELAITLTGLDVCLLRMLRPEESFAGSKEFTDFQLYLHAILENELSGRSHGEILVRVEIAIKAAFFCIYVYRNLSSGRTIVAVVHSILEKIKIGSKLPPKILLLESHLNEMIQNIGPLGFDMLHHHQKLDQITVIPSAFYINGQLEEIYASCIVHSSKESGIILSEKGQKSLNNLISLVKCCQGEVKMAVELSSQEKISSLPKLDMPIPSLPSPDLKDLGLGNLILEHWILTRVLNQD